MTQDSHRPATEALTEPAAKNAMGTALGTVESIEHMPVGDAAEFLASHSPADAAELASALPPQVAGGILAQMESAAAAAILDLMHDTHASAILGVMCPDDRVDVLQFVSADRRNTLVGLLNADDAAEVRKLEPNRQPLHIRSDHRQHERQHQRQKCREADTRRKSDASCMRLFGALGLLR